MKRIAAGAAALTCFLWESSVFQDRPSCPTPWKMQLVGASKNVLEKRRGEHSFVPASVISPICEGSTVFVKPDVPSKVSLEALDGSIKIDLGSGSLFEVTRTPPRISKINETKSFLAEPQPASLETTDTEQFKQVDTRRPGIRVVQEIGVVRIAEPKGNLVVVSQKYPATLTFTLDSSTSPRNLWVHLWSAEGDRKLVGSLFGKNSSTLRVPIPKPGVYVAQVVAEDESRVSAPLDIQAVETLASVFKEVVASNSNLTLVLK